MPHPLILPDMTKSGLSLPRTRVALERLAQSVGRLEGAVAARTELDERLVSELEAARAEQEALQEVVGTVSDRLDGAILRLQTALEEE